MLNKGTTGYHFWYDAVLDWGLNPGPPVLEASTIPLGYRGGSKFCDNKVCLRSSEISIVFCFYNCYLALWSRGLITDSRRTPMKLIKPILLIIKLGDVHETKYTIFALDMCLPLCFRPSLRTSVRRTMYTWLPTSLNFRFLKTSSDTWYDTTTRLRVHVVTIKCTVRKVSYYGRVDAL